MHGAALNSDADASTRSSNTAVGVTIITGFLGSGKSTLIRRVLTENHGMRIVVVENEFADNAAVEEAIVTQGIGPAAMEEFIELPNGCICCAAQDDLTDALSRLVAAKKGRFDHVLVEASGLADPGPVAASFWVDEDLEADLRLDGVIAIADAANVQLYLQDEGGESQKAKLTHKQLVVADLVLLNKVDLLEKGELNSIATANEVSSSNAVSDLCDLLRKRGCSAPIVATTRCSVDISQLLNIRAYDGLTSQKEFAKNLSDHMHSDPMSVGSTTISFENATFESSLLDRVLGELLWEQDSQDDSDAVAREIWRMKALVVIQGSDYKWIYQSVHTLFDSAVSSVEVSSDNNRYSHFILIGRGLQTSVLRQYLSQATVENDNS